MVGCGGPTAHRLVPTCDKDVFDPESQALQLLITGEFDPHESAGGRDQARVLSSAEAIDERWKPKRPIADFYVIEAALERRLDVVILIELQLDPLSGKGCEEQRRGGAKERGTWLESLWVDKGDRCVSVMTRLWWRLLSSRGENSVWCGSVCTNSALSEAGRLSLQQQPPLRFDRQLFPQFPFS